MDQNQEREIIGRVLKGEREAYALLVDEYKTPIYNLAHRMTGNLEDAEDLTQDAFIRAYKYLWRYDQRRKFFTWLYTIALNLIKNHLKKEKDSKAQVEIDSVYVSDNNTLHGNEYIAAGEISSSLLKLEEDQRALIIMKYQQELSFEEIAEITGKNLSTVKMRVYRGLERLKKLMSE